MQLLQLLVIMLLMISTSESNAEFNLVKKLQKKIVNTEKEFLLHSDIYIIPVVILQIKTDANEFIKRHIIVKRIFELEDFYVVVLSTGNG